MLSKIRNRKVADKEKVVEDDTKEFLLNRDIKVKSGIVVDKEYRIYEFLGSGKFGDVNRCEEKATGYILAAKVIPICSSDEKEAVMNEVEIMGKLRHARLIQLYDVFVQQDRITLIMELITGGELFERIIDESFELDEATCEKFMRQILQGVEYIHTQHIVHLDLKPENILCLSRTGFRIKIIDFGLARKVNEGELRVMFGTPEFVAPEVISYDPVTYATDMWSVGVICYVLLSGLSPFMGDNESETLSNILRCHYTFDYPEFKDISTDAKDFIQQLLLKNPQKRNSAQKCLLHSWLKEKPRLKRTATVSKKRLRHFVYRRKWQKAVNAIIALQRMGVVLTHTPNKEPEYRKLLQAKSTKTAALFRKTSLRGQAPSKASADDIKRNQSFSNANEAHKDNPQPNVVKNPPKEPITSSPTVKHRHPQITITNPTVPNIKKPTENLEPTKISTLNQMPPKSPTKEDSSKFGKTDPDPQFKFAEKQAQTKCPSSDDASKAIPQKLLPSKVIQANSSTQGGPNPVSKVDRKSQIPQITPSPPNWTTANGRGTFSVESTSKKEDGKKDDSVVMKMAALSKSRGSVADRISYFTSPSDKKPKGANKKFSLYN